MAGRTSKMHHKPFSVVKMTDVLLTYMFDIFQIFNVSHLPPDKLKDGTIRNRQSNLTLNSNDEQRLTPGA